MTTDEVQAVRALVERLDFVEALAWHDLVEIKREFEDYRAKTGRLIEQLRDENERLVLALTPAPETVQ